MKRSMRPRIAVAAVCVAAVALLTGEPMVLIVLPAVVLATRILLSALEHLEAGARGEE